MATPSTVKRYTYLIATVWTLTMGGSLAWQVHDVRINTLAKANVAARMVIEADLSFRNWNALHGGVYVPVTGKTRPNPYLNDPARDVITNTGKQLTLVNPAYMMRQLYESAGRQEAIKGHLTSLKLLRPENRPDPWEEQSLRAFEKGAAETTVVENMGGTDHMRLMRPLVATEACLKCHQAQGYKAGEIRGGLSVSVSLAPFRAVEAKRITNLSVAHGLLWGVVIGGIALFGRRQLKSEARNLQAEEQLKRSEERYRTFLEFSSDGIWRFRLEKPVAVSASEEEQIAHFYRHAYIRECNDAMARIHGYQCARDMVGMRFGALLPRLSKENIEYLRNFIRSGYRLEKHESRQLDRMGNVRYFQDSLTGIVEGGFLIRIWGVQHDITELKRLTEHLESISITDPLTGLYNRRGFLTLAEQQFRIAGRTKRGMLILFMDLDGLKWINDRLGHQQGDAALLDMAAVLRKSFRGSDILARMGGDEFAVLALEGHPEDAKILSENLQREIALHNETEERPYRLSASVGAVFYDAAEPIDLETLLNRADQLMYRAKEKKERGASAIIRDAG